MSHFPLNELQITQPGKSEEEGRYLDTKSQVFGRQMIFVQNPLTEMLVV